jgi:ribose transport system substrate-binding protein
MGYRSRRPLCWCAAVVAVLTLLTGCGSSQDNGPVANPKAPYVVLSNSFIGNAWRQTMVNQFVAAATDAKEKGLIRGFKVANAPGDNSATEQIGQINSLLLEKPDILLIDPASPSALAPVIKLACESGTTVVAFDSEIDSPCAYTVLNSFTDWAAYSTKSVVGAMGGKGNLVISRGVVGSQPEQAYYGEQQKVLAGYPNVKVVGQVIGLCNSSVAQKAMLGVLSSLPRIDGVAGCGDGLGIAQALQTAGRPIPPLAFEPSGRALRFWADNKVANGSLAIMSDPGLSRAALYTGLQVRAGKDVPHRMIFPIITIHQEQRDAWLKVLSPEQIAAWPWDADLTRQQIHAAATGAPPVQPPLPQPAQ